MKDTSKVVTLPFGQMPAGIAMNIAIFDLATHCCDLAEATGQGVDDDELLGAALEIGHGFLGASRMPELFKPELPAPTSASAADRLLAFAGRTHFLWVNGAVVCRTYTTRLRS